MLFILNIYFFSESATDTFSPSSQVRSLSLIAQKRLWGHKGGGTLQGCCWNIEAHKRGCGEDLKAVCSGQRPYGVDKGRMEWTKAVWSEWRPYEVSEGRMEWVKAVWSEWRPYGVVEGRMEWVKDVWSVWTPYGGSEGRMEWVKVVGSEWRPYGVGECRMEIVKAVWSGWRPYGVGEGRMREVRAPRSLRGRCVTGRVVEGVEEGRQDIKGRFHRGRFGQKGSSFTLIAEYSGKFARICFYPLL